MCWKVVWGSSNMLRTAHNIQSTPFFSSPQLRNARTTKSLAQALRPRGPMNSIKVTHDSQIIHRSKGSGFNNTPIAPLGVGIFEACM